MTPNPNDDPIRDAAEGRAPASPDDASAMSDAEIAASLRKSDPLAAEAAGADDVGTVPIDVAEGATATASREAIERAERTAQTVAELRPDSASSGPSEVTVVPIDVADVPTAVGGSRDAPAAVGEPTSTASLPTAGPEPTTFARLPIRAAEDRVAPATEPAVDEVAPLAVTASSPVVVRTRTGPVALETQPEPIPIERPAPVAVRGLNDPEPATIAVPKPARLASLDIFRGLTIALMVLVNNPGPGTPYGPLQHAAWHGWTITDLVFPFFLFIVGVATPFSLGKRRAIGGESRAALLGHIWLRALALILLGILLAGINLPLPFRGDPTGFPGTKAMRLFGFGFAFVSLIALLIPWRNRAVARALPIAIAGMLIVYCVAMHFVREKALAAGWDAKTFGGGVFNPDMLRLPGVLQRIGLCYGVAATVALLLGRFGAWVLILATIGLYSWLMLGVSFKGSTPGSLEKYDNLARSVDVFALERWKLNAEGVPYATQRHTYSGYPDPEGLVSTLPAIATTLIGVLAGFWLRRADRTPAERCAGLLARGVVVACVGVLLSWWLMPVNKQLWTPSYAVLSAGLAMLTLGAIFWTADVRGRRWWAWPLKVMGVNAIAAFVASSLVVRVANLFPFDDAKMGRTNAVSWLKRQAADGVVRASAWADAHAAWLPPLDTPQNTSLAGAVAFLLVIFALMLVLYVCRIRLKV